MIAASIHPGRLSTSTPPRAPHNRILDQFRVHVIGLPAQVRSRTANAWAASAWDMGVTMGLPFEEAEHAARVLRLYSAMYDPARR